MFITLLFAGSLILFGFCVTNMFYFANKNLPFSSNASYALFILNFFGAIFSLVGLLFAAMRISFLEKEVSKLDDWLNICGTNDDCVNTVLDINLKSKKN